MTRILDPTLRAETVRPAARAPRPPSLSGATLGLLANGKTHGMVFLERVAELLRARHHLAEVVRLTKANASVPARPEDGALLAGRCAGVVTAIGD
ncbi:MAG TPA: hypothetical protein VEL75_05120 [Candidatus Methylomirabilis sp.]|nr:hypothetical protein [Candidatus Methylomirabilis sp.]